jgi:hypothetical protein
VLDSLSGLCVTIGMIIHYAMIDSRQEYREGDEFFKNFFGILICRRNKNPLLKRKIAILKEI